MSVRILEGDAIEMLRTLEAGSVQVCVTSPPYFQLRDYGVHGQIGLERTPAEFVAKLVGVFEEVRRVLRDDATLWVNLGDSYAGSGKGPQGNGLEESYWTKPETRKIAGAKTFDSIKPKDLMLIPERFVIAMQEAGWYVRSKIVWSKASCMPESVSDRPTSAWEPIFLFAKSRTYFYDAEAVRTETGANLRNVLHLGPEPSRLEHYAAFPTAIPRTAILAGTSEKGACPACGAPWRRVVERTPPPDLGRGRQAWTAGATAHPQRDSHGGLQPVAPITLGWEPACRCDAGDPRPCVVLDPFGGSGTTGLVADRLGRDAVLIELSPEYAAMARRRIQGDAPLFAEVSA